MSIREVRADVWQVRVYVGVIEGRQRFAYATVRGKRHDALTAERRMALTHGSKRTAAVYDLTLGEYLVGWYEDYVRGMRAEGTELRMKMTLNKRILPELGGILLRDLTPQHIQRFYRQTSKVRFLGKSTGIKPGTLRLIHAILHAALDRAVKNDIIERNPADRIDMPQYKPYKPRVLTPEEAALLLDTAKDHPYYPMLIIALFGGLRHGEMVQLKWKDVNFEEGTLQVRQSKTEAGQRVVVLPPAATEVLASVKATSTSHYVLTPRNSGKGEGLSSLTISVLHHLCEKAGLPPIRIHDLRHTHATWLAAANLSARTIADRIGHTDASFTIRTYAHLSMEAQRQAAATVGGLLRLPESGKVK